MPVSSCSGTLDGASSNKSLSIGSLKSVCEGSSSASSPNKLVLSSVFDENKEVLPLSPNRSPLLLNKLSAAELEENKSVWGVFSAGEANKSR